VVLLHCDSCVQKFSVEEMGLLVPCLCGADWMRCDNWVRVSADVSVKRDQELIALNWMAGSMFRGNRILFRPSRQH
jgi:hypothetical protein